MSTIIESESIGVGLLKDGQDGQGEYIFIKYADSLTPSQMYDDPINHDYIGVYTGTSSTAPSSPSNYTWSKYVGQDGDSGKGIDSISYYYKVTTTQTAPDAGGTGWSDSIPSMSETDKYLWQKEVIDFTTGPDKVSVLLIAIYGDKGNNGTSVTITSTSIKYQASDSGTTTPTGTWSSSIPTVDPGKYLWTRIIVNYSNGTSTTSYSVAYRGTNGQDGTSNYSINIENDFVAIPTNASGVIPTGYSWQANTTHPITIFYGSTQVTSFTPIAANVTPTTGLQLKYSLSGVTIENYTTGTAVSTISPYISQLGMDEGHIIYTLYDGGHQVATGKFEATKNKQGAAGAAGAAATNYWLMSSAAAVAKNPNGSFKETSITFTPMKQTGTSAATSFTALLSWSVDGGTLKTATTSNLILYTGATTPSISTITSSLYIQMQVTSYTDPIVDKETLNVVKDGEDGQSGASNQAIVAYLVTNLSGATEPTYTTADPGQTVATTSVYEQWTTYSSITPTSATKYLYKCIGNMTTTTSATSYVWEMPTLVGWYNHNDAFVQGWAAFKEITAGSSSQGIYMNDSGEIFLDASYIKTGILQVGSNDNPLFYANVGSTAVSIAGWTVSSQNLNKSITVSSTTYTVEIAIPTTSISKVFSIQDGASSYPFYVQADGALVATKGSIGGWTIGEGINSNYNGIYHTVGNYRIGMQATNTNTNLAFYVRDSGTDVFYVNQKGEIFAKAGKIAGWTLSSNNFSKSITISSVTYNFGITASTVTTDKVFYVTRGTIETFSVYGNGDIVANNIQLGKYGSPTEHGRITETESYFFTPQIWLWPSNSSNTSKHLDLGNTTQSSSHYTQGLHITWSSSGTLSSQELGGNWGINGNFLPTKSITYNVGSSLLRWSTMYANIFNSGSASLTGSSRNKKKDITSLTENYSIFFDNLIPRKYLLKDGTSNRIHLGMIVDEVKDAMDKANLTPQDVAAYCLDKIDEPDGSGALRYDEFIPLTIWQVQKLKSRVSELEAEISSLKSLLKS